MLVAGYSVNGLWWRWWACVVGIMNIVLFIIFTQNLPGGLTLETSQKMKGFDTFADCQRQRNAILITYKNLGGVDMKLLKCMQESEI